MTDFSRKRTKPEDWEDIEPSKVIHIRELAEHTLEIDVCRALEKYGLIRDIAMIPKRRQALVEFEAMQSAMEVVKKYRNDSIYIANRPAKVNYSTSEHVVKRSGPNQSQTVSSSNKVLIFFIYDAIYPINVDVITKICKPHGKVVRIFINRKAAVMQALVEFYSLDDAIRVKRNLNGADIYSGCCTLKIEYATTNRVNVVQNSEDSVDYESPSLPTARSTTGSHSLLGLPNSVDIGSRAAAAAAAVAMAVAMDRHHNIEGRGGTRRNYYHDDDDVDSGNRNRNDDDDERERRIMVPLNHNSLISSHHHNYNHSSHNSNGQSRDSLSHYNHHNGGGGININSPRVAMIYGLNLDHVNCDVLFNLLCLYGNVVKIKFLKSKEGSAMVQMSDRSSLERMMSLLHNRTLFDGTLQFQISKQPVIVDVPAPYTLPDGSESFRDFSKRRENRFVTVEQAGRNRVFPPSRTINYWNAPPDFSWQSIRAHFLQLKAAEPVLFLQLTNRNKSSSGLLQWDSVEDAVNAVALCNHSMIRHDGARFPYQLKLSFSQSPIRQNHHSDRQLNDLSQRNHDNDDDSDGNQGNNSNNNSIGGGGGGNSHYNSKGAIRNKSASGTGTGSIKRGRY